MSGFEVNKIIAAIMLALIILFIIAYIGNKVVKIDENKENITAYIIEIPEPNTSSVVSESINNEDVETISNLLITASLENGGKLYKKCASCHNHTKDSKSKIGPNLWDIVNRSKGSIRGFAYSKALVEFGGIWNYKALNQFLYKPKEYIKGTKMNFAGLKNTQDRADLILWLRQNSENPISLTE